MTHEDNPATVRLLNLSEVMKRTLKSRSAIYAAIRSTPPTFPRPIKDGISSRWLESEISAWLGQRIAERDARYAA